MWEDKKQVLQNEIRQLQKHKEELEQLLDSHLPQCKMMRKTAHYPTNTKAPLLPAMPNLMPIPNAQQQPQQQQQQQQQQSHVQQQPIKEERHESDESSSDGIGLIEFTRPTTAPRPRPTSLPVASHFTNAPTRASNNNWHEIAGIAITTPSSGIPGFNFDSLMEGGTGLTPVVPSPSCGTQQQRSNTGGNGTTLPVDLSSPDAVNRKHLVSL